MNTKMAKGCKERCEEANRSEAVDVLTTFWQIGKVLPNRFSLIAKLENKRYYFKKNLKTSSLK